MRRTNKRNGLSIPEWFCILGLLGIAVYFGVGAIGNTTQSQFDTRLNGDDGLLGRQAAAGGGTAATAKSPKGNNGLGNGIDPAPPGNPPENDGAGTSPGNPGNKGGK